MQSGQWNGGLVLEHLKERLPFEFIVRYGEPDGTFPTACRIRSCPKPLGDGDLVRDTGADLGIAWDGDFDRCFFFDERGEFVEGITSWDCSPGPSSSNIRAAPSSTTLALLGTRSRLWKPRRTSILCKSGPRSSRRRCAEDAVYGGEMSAHHYFRDFSYCDSGMIPWLLITELLCARTALSELVAERIDKFPCSGEINRTIADPDAALKRVEEVYASSAKTVMHVDGVSMEFDRWRFNLRKSNTEPLVRLNVETKGDRALLQEKTEELLKLLAEVSG